jgi:tetratricopeptide (TPR) repeat protein
VRLAHEALIDRWDRARLQLAADRRDLETRALIEQQQVRWMRTRGRGRNKLLLRNPDLEAGIDLLQRMGQEVESTTRDFIQRSRRAVRVRVVGLTLGVASPLLVGAFAGVILAVLGMIVKEEARYGTYEALDSIDALNTQIVQPFLVAAKPSSEEVASAFEKTNLATRDFSDRYKVDFRLAHTRYYMYRSFGMAFERAGDLDNALKCATEALELDRKRILSNYDKGEFGTEALQFFAVDNKIGTAIAWYISLKKKMGDAVGALLAAERQLEILTRVSVDNQSRWRLQTWQAYRQVGDMRMEREDLDGAEMAYKQMLVLAEQVEQNIKNENNDIENEGRARRNLALSLRSMAVLKEKQSNWAGALADIEKSISINRELLSIHSIDEIDLVRELVTFSQMHGRVGNLTAKRAAYNEALALLEERENNGSLPDEAMGWSRWLREEIANIAPVETKSQD